MSCPTNFAELEADIINACNKHEQKSWCERGYRRAFPFQGYFIKFDSHLTFHSEVMTLKYLADLAAMDPSAPRIPRILHYFYKQGGMGYAVMELIQLVHVPPEVLAKKTADAIHWMRNVPAPDDVVLGPKGQGRPHHEIFKDFEAPQKYSSVTALERYLNKAVQIMRRRWPRKSHMFPDIKIADEPLVLTQSRMDCSDFGADTAGRPVIFHTRSIGWLPESLELFTLLRTTYFARNVAEHLFTPEGVALLRTQPKLNSMSAARVLLGTAAASNLNLDEDGNEMPKNRVRKDLCS